MVIAPQHVSRGNRSRSLHLVLRRSSVHARLPQTLSAAAVMCALAAGGAAAQAPSPPQVSVGALTYLQYVYQLKDTANHLNNFEVTRAYINVNGRLSNGVTARITPDVFRTLTGLSFRLKYAFVTYTPTASPLTFKLGQMHTPWLDWEEAVWDYRMQGSMALDRNGYLSASDLGAGVDGKWGPDKVNLQVTAVNGEDFKSSAGDQRKDVMGRVAVLARVDVVDPNTNVADDRQTRVIGGVSYQLSPNLRLLADWDYVDYQGTPTAAQEATRSQALFQTQFSF